MHYFLQKGHSIKELRQLTKDELIFMEASMEVAMEMREDIMSELGNM